MSYILRWSRLALAMAAALGSLSGRSAFAASWKNRIRGFKTTKVVDRPTALMQAAGESNHARILGILKGGADPHVTTKIGVSALTNARDVKTLELLLKNGVNPNLCNRWEETALHKAAKSKKPQALERAAILLKHGANPNVQDQAGDSALHYAVKDSTVEMVKLLLEHGADPNLIAFNTRRSPIMEAAFRKDFGIYELLKAKGGKLPPNVEAPQLGLRLFDALAKNDAALVRKLLASGAKADTRKPHTGETPLWRALTGGNVPIAKLLIASGADVNALNGKGQAALHQAASRPDNDRSVLLILSLGANINAPDSDGARPLHYAALTGDPYSALFLLSRKADLKAETKSRRTPLHHAAETPWVRVVRVLLKAGADPNATDAEGMTSLHLAARKGARKVVQALLAGGTKVNAQNARGRTPLHLAAARGRVDILKVLLKAKADLNLPDKDGRVPVHLARTKHVVKFLKANMGATAVPEDLAAAFHQAAAQGNVVRLGELLTAQPGVIDKADADGRTALHLAAATGRQNAVGLLVLRGANVNAVTKDGSTPLHAAAAAGHKDVVRDLFARRPDVNARDKTGATPLHLAAAGGHAEVVGLLLTKGADVNAKDKEGRTARDAAKSPEIAAVLRRATGRADPPQTPKTPVRPEPGPDTQPSVPKERPKQEPPREPKKSTLPTVSGKVTVHLKDGKNATGQVFKSRPESVTLQVSGMALRTYKADRVKRIEQGGRVVFDADSVEDNNK